MHNDHLPATEGVTPTTKVTLSAVSPEKSPENKQFWEATPSGEVVLYIKNGEAAKQFVEGKEYYIDFTPA